MKDIVRKITSRKFVLTVVIVVAGLATAFKTVNNEKVQIVGCVMAAMAAIIDFFDATSDTTYNFNINKSMGTFPVLMKDQASVTLRTSAGNFTAGTGVYIFNKLWITNQ